MQGGVAYLGRRRAVVRRAFLLDGAMHNDPQNNLNLPLPFPDALQEFRVATSGLTAENGMHSGASVNAVTKSGTNRFSGNVFEFLRDHRFNATNPFALKRPDGKRQDDGLVRNQFGGTLGGPIVRNKLFFFGGLPGHHASVKRRRRTSPWCRQPRCWPATSRRSRHPRATAAGRSHCEEGSRTTGSIPRGSAGPR